MRFFLEASAEARVRMTGDKVAEPSPSEESTPKKPIPETPRARCREVHAPIGPANEPGVTPKLETTRTGTLVGKGTASEDEKPSGPLAGGIPSNGR